VTTVKPCCGLSAGAEQELSQWTTCTVHNQRKDGDHLCSHKETERSDEMLAMCGLWHLDVSDELSLGVAGIRGKDLRAAAGAWGWLSVGIHASAI
jgi:hypothetical protein